MRKFLPIITLAVATAGCSPPDSLTQQQQGGTGPGQTTVVMGMGSGGNFVPDVIDVGVANLSAGGSTSLQVSLVVPPSNTLFPSSVDVAFTSDCVAQGLATVTTPVTTTTGLASSTYVATGCSGLDNISATATVSGGIASASGTITVAAASVGSISFDSATPENIALQGTGGTGRSETSTVVFNVVDQSGGPVAGTDVDFTLNTTVGGITLTPTTATSDATGRVQTVVQAGTVATTVRVTATVQGLGISTQSSQLTITTGIPDANSMSLAVFCANVEAFNNDGVLNAVTARLSDRFNNPVPDGTAVTFTTEGGSIAGQCTTATTPTESGVCTVNWVSSDPRPVDGRSSLLVTAIGEESFTDNNGNGRFDAGEPFMDLPEAFLDDNENGMRDVGESFFDFNNNGAYDMGDGLFNGLLCDPAVNAQCSAQNTLGIGAGNLIVMSGSTAVIANDVGGVLMAPGTVTFTIGDARNQPMPAGTTVKAEVTNGQLIGPTSYDIPCTGVNSPLQFPFTVDADATSSAGLLFVTVETPDGIITTASITVND